MIEPKDETIDGMLFHFNPLPATMALKLDKEIITLITPALGGVDKLDLSTNINLKIVTQGIGEALRGLDGDSFIKFVLDLCSATGHTPKGGVPELISNENFDKVFTGKNKTVYKLIFALMKYNKFLPFELLGGGNVMNIIRSLEEKTKKVKKNGSA